jgi:uncharacterized protein
MNELLFGLSTGVIFGFFLQRARVIRYDKQLGALRLRDMTIVKFMLTSIIVAAIGIYLLLEFELVKLSIKPMILGPVVIGGLIFGIGWGLFGYCPGTSLGALGEGRVDALWGIAGMLVGASLYAETFPMLKATVLTWGDFGKVTIPGVLGVSPWLVIAVLTILALALFRFLERRKL